MSINLRNGFVDESLERVLEDLLVRFVINCPPEDLSSIERVFFQIEEAQWFYQDFIRVLNNLLPSMKMKSFTSKILEQCPMVWKWGDPKDALARFGKYKSAIPVRGCALLNERLDKILLVQGVESSSWGFPRGKISKDETDVECAIRELEEETGFDCTNYINEDEYIERTIKGKNYKIYIVRDVPEDTVFEPKVRNEINAIEWKDFKYVMKSCKNSNQFYLVSAMIKPLQSFISRAKGLQTEEELKKQATIQLKKILGVGKEEKKQEQLDPGRELLNMLQQVAKGRQPSVLEAPQKIQDIQQKYPQQVPQQVQQQSQPQISGFSPYQQLPLQHGSPFPLPRPLPSQFNPMLMQPTSSGSQMPFLLQFFNPFMQHPSFGLPPQFPTNFPTPPPQIHHPTSHPMNISETPKLEFIAPAPSSFSKPSFELANRRSKEANSKELLNILNSKPSPPKPSEDLERRETVQTQNNGFLKGLFDKYKNGIASSTQYTNTVNSKSVQAKPKITIMKREKPVEADSKEHLNNINDMRQKVSAQIEEPFSVNKPANDSASASAGGPSPMVGKKITLLKRPTSSGPSSPHDGASELLGLLKKGETETSSSNSDSQQLLSILKAPKAATKQENQHETSSSSSSSDSNQLLNILKPPKISNNVEKPPALSASSQLLGILNNPRGQQKKDPSADLLGLLIKTPQEQQNKDPSTDLLSLLKKPQEQEKITPSAKVPALLNASNASTNGFTDPSKDLMNLLNSANEAATEDGLDDEEGVSNDEFESAAEDQELEEDDGEENETEFDSVSTTQEEPEEAKSDSEQAITVKSKANGLLSMLKKSTSPVETTRATVGTGQMNLFQDQRSSYAPKLSTASKSSSMNAEPTLSPPSASNQLLGLLHGQKTEQAQKSAATNPAGSPASQLLNVLNKPSRISTTTTSQSYASQDLLKILSKPTMPPQQQATFSSNELLNMINKPQTRSQKPTNGANELLDMLNRPPLQQFPNGANELLGVLNKPEQSNNGAKELLGMLNKSPEPPSQAQVTPGNELLSVLNKPQSQTGANELLGILGRPQQQSSQPANGAREILGVLNRSDATSSTAPTAADNGLLNMLQAPSESSSHPLMNILNNGGPHATPPVSNPLLDLLKGQQSTSTQVDAAPGVAATQQPISTASDDEELEFEDFDELNAAYEDDEFNSSNHIQSLGYTDDYYYD